MITENEIIKVGRFRKPHGVNGDMTFTLTADSLDESKCKFVVCEIDGIFVPFRIEDIRFTTDDAGIISLAGFYSAERVRFLINKDIYVTIEAATATQKLSSMQNFTLVDETTGKRGLIKDIDTTTANTLFVVDVAGEEFLIPVAEEYFTDIDEKNKILSARLPEGLI
jgi:16S rRNA processing protein RimM